MTEPASRAPRRPTADPHRFLIPADQLPPGFAERVDDPGFEPVATRPASTVVLARDGACGMETLLLLRPQRSGFAGGAWVFPGGRVDASDGDASLLPEDAQSSGVRWAERLGVEDPEIARGYVIAALREAWEETGILIGRAAAASADRLAGLRREVLAGECSFADAVRNGGIQLHLHRMVYLAHWVTPEPEPRRYDTRFFLARAEPGAECVLEGDELSEARWVSPVEAVESYSGGKMMLLPPTVDTLRRLAAYDDLRTALAELGALPVPRVLPTMRRDPDGVVIEY